MKSVSFRTALIFLTVILSVCTEAAAQTYERTFSFKYGVDDFTLTEATDGYRIIPDTSLDWHRKEDYNKPALPFICHWILLPDNYKIINFTLSHHGNDACFAENIVLAPNPTPVPISDGERSDNDKESPYPLVEYPSEIISLEERTEDGYRIFGFSINPFTYYADIRKLTLATAVDLKITIMPVDEDKKQGHKEDISQYLRSIIYNPEDIGNGTLNWEKMDLEPEDAEISLHVENLRLADLITEGQKLSVKTLNITGRLTEEDYAFIRNNSLPQLKDLNLREADIETIPVKAFCNYGKTNPDDICRVTLPEKLVSIGDSAFYDAQTDLVLTGKFPQRGTDAFSGRYDEEGYVTVITLAKGNEYCKSYIGEEDENYILSSDGKILYYSQENSDETIPEGVEVIAERAFEGRYFSHISFPESLTRIEDYAFYNSSIVNKPKLKFASETPPMLGKEVFSHIKRIEDKGESFTLYIPETWEGIYTQKDEQWKIFKDVVYWTTDTIPADTGQVMPPVRPSEPDVYVPVIREEDNVTEYPHNPVEGKAEQEFVMSLEGEYLRIKGTLKARGYDKHYIHCQIIGDSVHLQRYDMDPESTDMILHHVDIRIPGFTGNYYHVTLAEQNDIPLYKPYMVASRAVTRNLNGMDDAVTALPAASVQATGSTLTCTATDAVKLEVYTPEAVKVGEAQFTNGTATVKVSKAPAMYLHIVTYPDGRRESGKVMMRE